MFVKQSKSHGRIYLSFAVSYRKDGRVRSRTIEKIGYLDELEKTYADPLKHFQEEAKKQSRKKAPLSLNLDTMMKENEDDFKNIGYFPFKKLFNQIGLRRYFQNQQRNSDFDGSLGSIFLFLLINRIMFPSSIEKAYLHKNRYFEAFDFSMTQVYRAYDWFYAHLPQLKRKLYKGVSKIYTYRTKYCRYDVTNYFYEIRYPDVDVYDENGKLIHAGLRKKGYSKENRRTPITQLGLLLDENGIPIDYTLFPGNESEKKSLRPVLKQAKQNYHIDRIVVVADRGINTGNNTGFLSSTTGDGYIFGESILKKDQAFKDWVLEQEGYEHQLVEETDAETGQKRRIDFKHKSWTGMVTKTIRNDEGKVIGTVNVLEKQMVYYSKKYAAKQKKEREKVIKKAKYLLKHPGAYHNATHQGAAAYIKNVESLEENGQKHSRKQKKASADTKTGSHKTERAKPILDLEKIEEEEKYDGYFCIITSETETSDLELRNIYKQLWEIEQNFKITKSEFKARPVYVSTQEHIEVHFFICYTALVFFNLLRFKLGKDISYSGLLNSLRNMNCLSLEQNIYAFGFRNEVVDHLSKYFDVELNRKYLTLKEIRHIVKY